MSEEEKSDYEIGPWQYYADWITVPVMAILSNYLNGWPFTRGWAAAAAAGFALWSLAEYCIHRWVLHGPYREQHHQHHVRPPDYIGASPYNTFAIIVAIMICMPGTIGAGLFTGLLAGYFAYIFIHDQFHHEPHRPGSLIDRLNQNHELHHRKSTVNYGVGSPLWDRVFGTYEKPNERVKNRVRE